MTLEKALNRTSLARKILLTETLPSLKKVPYNSGWFSPSFLYNFRPQAVTQTKPKVDPVVRNFHNIPRSRDVLEMCQAEEKAVFALITRAVNCAINKPDVMSPVEWANLPFWKKLFKSHSPVDSVIEYEHIDYAHLVFSEAPCEQDFLDLQEKFPEKPVNLFYNINDVRKVSPHLSGLDIAVHTSDFVPEGRVYLTGSPENVGRIPCLIDKHTYSFGMVLFNVSQVGALIFED